MPRRKRNTGFHYPDYNYCGPFTKNKGAKPKNRIDYACKQHDEDKDFDYFYYNDADERLIRAMEKYRDDDPMAADIIKGVFSTKKYVTPYKRGRYELEDKEGDLPSNSLSNDSTGTSNKSTKGMYSGKRSKRGYRKPSGRRNLRKRGYSAKPKTSKRSRSTKSNSKGSRRSIAKTIARIMNPAKQYEYQSGNTVILNGEEVNYFIDPHIIASNTRTTFTDKNLFGLSRIQDWFFKVTATTFASGDVAAGQSFWALKAKEYFKLSNFSNSTMQIRAYWVKNKLLGNYTPVEYISGSPTSMSTAVYTGTTPANLIPVSGQRMSFAHKTMSIYDFKEFLQHWQIVQQKNIKLEPNDTTQLVLNHGSTLVQSDNYFSSEYARGHLRLLLVVSTELTADGTVTTANRTKGYAYTNQSLVIALKQSVYVAQRVTSTRKDYIEIPTGVHSNIGTNPQMVGDPVDDAGAPMNDVS